MAKMLELRFRAVEGVDFHHPLSLLAGRSHVVGKTWDKDAEEYKLNAEPETVRMSPQEFVFWSVLFNKAVKNGEILCADKGTAERFGVQFKAEQSATKRSGD